MKSNFLLILLLMVLCKMPILGQNSAGCDGIRYVNEVFTSTIQTTVKYGENQNFGITEELFMDIFEPENDTLSKRPVAVFAHGGSYLIGSRTDMNSLCIGFAKRGYVAATIDYRKLQVGTILDTINIVEAIVRTMQDMKAAVRYFRNDSNTDNIFRVDSNFVFVGGLSAGAITALHTAYWSESDNSIDYINDIVMSEGGLEGQSNDFLDVSSQVKGVVNLSGAILKSEWIQATEPPIVSYHGTNDNIVPIGTGLVVNAIVMDGSEVIHQQASQEDIPNYIYAVSGGGHADIYGSIYINEFNTFWDSSSVFFEERLCGQTNSVSPEQFVDQAIVLFPNPTIGLVQINGNNIEDWKIRIWNTTGSLIKSHQLTENGQMEISHLPSGFYFLELSNGNQSVTKRIIKE